MADTLLLFKTIRSRDNFFKNLNDVKKISAMFKRKSVVAVKLNYHDVDIIHNPKCEGGFIITDYNSK